MRNPDDLVTALALALPQYPDENRPERPILLAADPHLRSAPVKVEPRNASPTPRGSWSAYFGGQRADLMLPLGTTALPSAASRQAPLEVSGPLRSSDQQLGGSFDKSPAPQGHGATGPRGLPGPACLEGQRGQT